jgi:5-formaminoimidazole-4-carboxamide-1-beta-D-ribofuranosyl 5'-monophosphate synthetase
MMYVVEIEFMVKDDVFEIGDIVDEKDIPKKSKKWLVDQGIIVKEDLVRARNEKGHFIADDPSTEENEAWKEEE